MPLFHVQLDLVFFLLLYVFFWYFNKSITFPLLYLNALNLAIWSHPNVLQPIGLLLILEDKTWLTWPSAQHPQQPPASSTVIFLPSQLFKKYFSDFLISSILFSSSVASNSLLYTAFKASLSALLRACHIFSFPSLTPLWGAKHWTYLPIRPGSSHPYYIKAQQKGQQPLYLVTALFLAILQTHVHNLYILRS